MSTNSKETINRQYAIVLILVSITLESFSVSSVRSKCYSLKPIVNVIIFFNLAVSAIYLKDFLKMTEDQSTSILHTFNLFCQFFPIIGAIIADTFWGNIK